MPIEAVVVLLAIFGAILLAVDVRTFDERQLVPAEGTDGPTNPGLPAD
jgi:hypothetical protein